MTDRGQVAGRVLNASEEARLSEMGFTLLEMCRANEHGSGIGGGAHIDGIELLPDCSGKAGEPDRGRDHGFDATCGASSLNQMACPGSTGSNQVETTRWGQDGQSGQKAT